MKHPISAYRKEICDALIANSKQLSQQWLESLQNVVNEHSRNIFPTEQYLDHIPSLIEEIGRIILSNDEACELTNSAVEHKAIELGTLRHQQTATVNQLLREYDLLSRILEDFIIAETKRSQLKDTPPDEYLQLIAAIARVVRHILQWTVDTFVEKYMQTIEMQTEKIVSFNRFVTHELKTPIQAAMLNIEMLLEEKDNEGGDSPELMRIHGSVTQASSLLTSIEHLAQDSRGIAEDTPTRQKIDLHSLLQDIITQLHESVTDHNIQFHFSPSLGTVVADTARLRLVLTNLLSNSIKYSDPKKPSRDIWVTEQTDSPSNACTIRIKDNGLGISEELQQEVFNIRFRAHENAKGASDIDGHGIGLYLAREAMLEMHGSISLQSKEQEWTTIDLSLPRKPA